MGSGSESKKVKDLHLLVGIMQSRCIGHWVGWPIRHGACIELREGGHYKRQTGHQQQQWKFGDNQNIPLSSFELACATNVGTFLLTRMTTSIFKCIDGPLYVDADGFGVFAQALNLIRWEADIFVGGVVIAFDVNGAGTFSWGAFLNFFSAAVHAHVSKHLDFPILHL